MKMVNKFRKQHPQRTYDKQYNNYQSYKPYLAKDFFRRCGYTDCPDFWFGGQGNFHIDHFRPWKNHPENPELKVNYQNLIYCCSYVNILKSNDETNYLDPCNIDFNKHFIRDNIGNIFPIKESEAANYMYQKLKLYMKRYQIIWILETIFEKMEKVKEKLESADNALYKDDLKEAMCNLACLCVEYKKYLSSNQ